MNSYKDSNKLTLDNEQLSALAQSKPNSAISLFCQSPCLWLGDEYQGLVVKPSKRKYKTSFSVK